MSASAAAPGLAASGPGRDKGAAPAPRRCVRAGERQLVVFVFVGLAFGLGTLAQAVWRQVNDRRDALLEWCSTAGQHEYAQLAPLVFECADTDAAAQSLVHDIGQEIEDMALALDPGLQLPIVLLGSIGLRMIDRLARRPCIVRLLGRSQLHLLRRCPVCAGTEPDRRPGASLQTGQGHRGRT